MPPRRAPTMLDVARAAGVSPMTVSRALKPGSPVSEPTRRRIREAADALGYILDARAAALSSSKSGFVGVVAPSLNNSNFADTVRGLDEGLRAAGLQLLIGWSDYSVDEEERVVETMLRRRPDAMVLTGGAHTARCRAMLAASGVPVVETWDLPAEPLGHVVGFSNAAASAAMVAHLLAAGFRRLAFVGGDASRDTRGADRRRGFCDAVTAHGLGPPRLAEVGPPPITVREGGAALRRLLARWPDTDAVMCVSDLSAFGALSEARRMGLRVPQDVAIAGFGAFDVAEASEPRITTIDVGAEEIGRLAAATVLRALADPGAAPARLTVDFRIMPRATTGRAD